MPVAAVTAPGRPRVSSGSAKTVSSWFAEPQSVITRALPGMTVPGCTLMMDLWVYAPATGR